MCLNMKSITLSLKPLVFLSVFILTACGGGGGGGSSDNLAPTITSANFQVEQDTDLVATLSATDPEGDTVAFSQTSDPSNGEMLAFAANGVLTYRPNVGFNGSDSFTISASDGTNQVSATITINILEVTPTNQAPTVTSANFELDQDSSLSAILTAIDPEDDVVTFTVSSDPTNGQIVAFDSDGVFTYTPNGGFTGSDSFSIIASDGSNQVDATITLNVLAVNPVNEAPTVTSANFDGVQNTELMETITATDPEGDTVTFAQTSEPANGSITAFEANGSFTYLPDTDFTGSDSFTITASDGINEVAATISITIFEEEPTNQPPTITSANFEGNQDTDLSATITASDPEGETVTFTQTSEPSNGSMIAFAANGDFTYRPNTGFIGTDSFTITASDGVNEVAATITLNVLEVIPSNEAPSFTSVSAANVDENTSSVVYTATATDADGDSLTFSINSSADQSAFSIDGTSGELTLITAADFEAPSDANADGVYEVTLNVDDGNGESAQLNLLLTITNVNEATSFTSASAANVDENTSGVVYTATATDLDGDNLTFSINSSADQSAFSIDGASGELTLTNAADFEAPSDGNTDGVYDIILNVDDGNGASDQLALTLTVEDVTQLALKVSYPTPNANLGGDVAFTSVTGFIEDLEDGEVLESDIDFVSVNSQAADIELPTPQDNVVRWRTQLPVTAVPHENTLDIELLDRSNNSQQISQLLFNKPILSNPKAIALDSANNRALVVDNVLQALIAIDLNSGEITVISDANTGGGTNLDNPFGITLDSANNRVLVVDSSLDALVAIDLTSGDRTLHSDDNTGTGPNLGAPLGITLDSANNRALVVDANLDALVAIDLDSGDRTVLSNSNTGTGPNLVVPRSITLDSANNRALVLDNALDAVFIIDLGSGDRNVLSDENTGTGPILSFPQSLTLDSTNNRILVLDGGLDALVAIDLDSGDRSIFSDDNTGTGVDLDFPQGIALDIINNRILVVDSSLNALIAIDQNSGDRTVLDDSNTGTGPSLGFPKGIALDKVNNRALIVDIELDALITIDLNSGDRFVFSGDNIGAGPNFGFTEDIALDSANNRALVVDSGLDAVVAISLDHGDRTVLSDVNTGTGPNLTFLQGITLDSANNRALVVDRDLDALIAIDLTSGDRTVRSDANTGSGPNLITPQGLALDSANNRALVVDRDLGALVAIDLNSGARTVLSDLNIGIGPNLGDPQDIALDSANNRALVVDNELDALVAIDLGSGDRIVISDVNIGTRLNLADPQSIALDSANNRVLVGLGDDSDLEALVVIDLGSGERAISSK